MLESLRSSFGIIIEHKWAKCGMDQIIFENEYLHVKVDIWNDSIAILLPFSLTRKILRLERADGQRTAGKTGLW